MMPMELVISLLVLAAACIIYFTRRKHPVSTAPVGSGIPEGLEAEYEQAVAPGSDGISVMYTLTTCRHCVHLHDFLDKHSIPHHQIYVDKYTGSARAAIMQQVRHFNPRGSFPTLVLPDGQSVAGFRENQVREAYHLDSPQQQES